MASVLLVVMLVAVAIFVPSVFNGDLYRTLNSASADDVQGRFPTVSTMTDSAGTPIAWFYDQNRTEVASEDISEPMKDAMVAIEDRRFWEHDGVDYKGVGRALWENITSGGIKQGSSTIEQQYIKNFNLYVDASSDEEREAATAQTIDRKLKEMKVAKELDDHMTKDEILTRYLNLVYFGNQAYGVEAAANTYFGVAAKDLTEPQAALLAGMVQSPTQYDPYQNPDDAKVRRDDVIDAVRSSGKLTDEQTTAMKEEPLGTLPDPAVRATGCISANDKGFFCDYAIAQLEQRGFPMDDLATGGYTIKTTLDPAVQASAKSAVDAQANPTGDGVAQTLDLLAPGKESHDILAMATNRGYGLDETQNQTMQSLPFSPVGAGAGSIFKVFTAAAAMEKGVGADTILDTPARYEASGMGTGGAAGCPADKYCVENAGTYKDKLSFSDALAQSPNTTFVKLQEQVGLEAVTDMAVRLGLRSYAEPGSAGDGDDRSLAQATVEDSRGSFTLGATAVDTLELSNVATTLASGGTWCEPNAVLQVTNSVGTEVPLNDLPCEQAVPEGLANTLANAMGKDVVNGTAAASARTVGWSLPTSAKTGTTESHGSSAFLGFTNTIAGSSYVFDDSNNPAPICTSPLRTCESGDVYGGYEPARAWMNAMLPVANSRGEVHLPPEDPQYKSGASPARVPDVVGKWADEASDELTAAKFPVVIQIKADAAEKGRVIDMNPAGSVMPGTEVTLVVSDGSLAPKETEKPAPSSESEAPEEDSEDRPSDAADSTARPEDDVDGPEPSEEADRTPDE